MFVARHADEQFLIRTGSLVGMKNDDAMNEPWTAGEIRDWARRQGIEIGERGRIPSHLIELYKATPSTVRDWARRQGIEVAERGRIPTGVMESYLSRPAAVREWARQRGIAVGDRGRLPAELVEAYLERFRSLQRAAA
jgi:hypothetical protein